MPYIERHNRCFFHTDSGNLKVPAKEHLKRCFKNGDDVWSAELKNFLIYLLRSIFLTVRTLWKDLRGSKLLTRPKMRYCLNPLYESLHQCSTRKSTFRYLYYRAMLKWRGPLNFWQRAKIKSYETTFKLERKWWDFLVNGCDRYLRLFIETSSTI